MRSFSWIILLSMGYIFASLAFADTCQKAFTTLNNQSSSNQRLDELTFHSIPNPYRVPLSQNDAKKIVVYRGDLVGLEKIGIRSKALAAKDFSKLAEVKRWVEDGDIARINRLIGSHTSGSVLSTFLSASFNPRLAQVFATNYPERVEKTGEETIYRIEIDANRALFDGNNVGCSSCSGEVFIFSEIRPEEITAVKIRTDDNDSELLSEGEILDFPKPEDRNRLVRDPSNWRILP